LPLKDLAIFRFYTDYYLKNFLKRGIPKLIKPTWEVLKPALKFGLLTAAAEIFWVGTSTLDDVIVGKLLGIEVLGYYAMAYHLSELPLSKINSIISPVLTSYFGRLKHDTAELYRIFLKFNKMFTALILPALIGLVIVAPEMILVVLGEKWMPMVPMFQVMCLVFALRAVSGNITRLFYAIGHPEKMLFYNAVTFFILIPSFLLLVHFYGEKGVYIAWLAVYPLTICYILQLLHKTTGIKKVDFLKQLKMPAIATTLMGSATMLAKMAHLEGLSLLILCILTGVLSYSGVLYLFFKEETKEIILSLKTK